MISLFMHGGPSHVDLLDPKPELSAARTAPTTTARSASASSTAPARSCSAAPGSSRKHGECGTEVSELLPETAEIVDDLCVIRSMHTGHNGHEVSIRYFHGGIAGITGRPTMGSWIVYGLGSESQDLPGLHGPLRPRRAPGRRREQLVERVHAPAVPGDGPPPQGAPDPQPRSAAPAQAATCRQQNLAFLDQLNRRHLDQHPGEADLEARIQSYELAAAMQTAAKEALDISGEPEYIKRMYGLDDDATREYGTRCLIARRLVERGVRFVQLFLGGQPWDNHNSIKTSLPGICRRTDKPSAALVYDLKQRGLLETTLVHWGGEIGRLPVSEGNLDDNAGRDHNGQGFSIWMAGGGIKGGMTFGATDEVGHRAVENVVTPNDFQATVLHLFGLDHEQLAYHANGRVQHLTNGQAARIVREILESPVTG